MVATNVSHRRAYAAYRRAFFRSLGVPEGENNETFVSDHQGCGRQVGINRPGASHRSPPSVATGRCLHAHPSGKSYHSLQVPDSQACRRAPDISADHVMRSFQTARQRLLGGLEILRARRRQVILPSPPCGRVRAAPHRLDRSIFPRVPTGSCPRRHAPTLLSPAAASPLGHPPLRARRVPP